jgi:ribonucleoside-diphosphate reductase alpha chain
MAAYLSQSITHKGIIMNSKNLSPQAIPPSTTWNGTEAARRVLAERYLMKNDNQVVETPEEMFLRVAGAIATAESGWKKTPAEICRLTGEFFQMMCGGLFLPNSPTLMNAGKSNGLQYSACYVLPVEDSIEGIFESVKRAALIHQSGGGTGFGFSRLRPRDALVHTTGGRASGPVSFMRVFNAATEAVKQGGTRRGANMGILRVDHPDIRVFINCKRQLSEEHASIFRQMAPHLSQEAAEKLKRALLDRQISNFNISVAATDAFMKAVLSDSEFDLVAPQSGQITGRLQARAVFEEIAQAAWETGDPGLVFIDRINAGPANPIRGCDSIEATNPCGEQPLYGNEACNLGSINLARFVQSNGAEPTIDWVGIQETVGTAIRFLDDVIEVNPYPLPVIEECVKANRRVGLGVMGWADMLMMLRIPYDSEEAVELGGKVMRFINEAAHASSQELARDRGPFPNFERSMYATGSPLRNATVTTIAPTGTISIIGGCSSGIEPIFALAYSHVVDGRTLEFINPIFEAAAQDTGLLTTELRTEVLRRGTLRGSQTVPKEFQRVFVTAHEIDPEWHILHQAAFQKHTDNGVSKTVNLPKSSTPEDIRKAYLQAYETGCLGVTVFRDGCKGQQVLYAGVARESQKTASPRGVKPRPMRVIGTTSVVKTPVGTAFVTINEDEKKEPLEVFVSVGKAGTDITADAEAIGRLISFALRVEAVMPPRDRLALIAKQLQGIGGSRSAGLGKNRIRSLADGVAVMLLNYLAEDSGEAAPAAGNAAAGDSEVVRGDLCPDCGNATVKHAEGCSKCESCAWSEC